MADEPQKEIRRACILCLPYLCLAFFRDDLDRLFHHMHSHLGNPLLIIYLIICSVLASILFMYSVVELRTSYRSYGAISLIPLFLYTISLINSFWSPISVSSDIFKSSIVHRANRKEKYGHAQMKMRQDGSLDIRYPGPFGLSDWEYGHWTVQADTFYLKFENSKEAIAADDMLSDTMILSQSVFHPLHMPQDSINKYRDYLFKVPINAKK